MPRAFSGMGVAPGGRRRKGWRCFSSSEERLSWIGSLMGRGGQGCRPGPPAPWPVRGCSPAPEDGGAAQGHYRDSSREARRG